jgi:hypothetical protein
VDTIVYTITKGKKHKVTDVSVAGNSQLKTPDLMALVTVKSRTCSRRATTASNWFAPAQRISPRSTNLRDSAVRRSLPSVSHKDGNLAVAFHVTEGPRDIVSSLKIEGADTFPESKFAPGGLKLAAGKPYSQKLVEADRASIVAHYLQAGYLTSSFRETAKRRFQDDPHHINVVYHIYEGPQVHTQTSDPGARANAAAAHRQGCGLHCSQSAAHGDRAAHRESQLYNHTGVFDWAEVDPPAPDNDADQEDVLVKVHEAKRNTMTYGFGFEVINRGGSIPSGTVALPNLPPVGLPSNFTTSQTTYYGPRGTFNTRATMCAARGIAFRDGVCRTPGSACRGLLHRSPISIGRNGARPRLSWRNATKKIRSFLPRLKTAATSCRDFYRQEKARCIFPALQLQPNGFDADRFRRWCCRRISMSGSPRLRLTSPAIPATILSMRTKVCCNRSNSTSIYQAGLQRRLRKIDGQARTTGRPFTTSFGRTAFALAWRSPFPTAVCP